MERNYIAWIPSVLQVAKEAAQAIMQIYSNKSYVVKAKPDLSPVTEADLLAHDILEKGLNKIKPGLPVLSEEGDEVPFDIRKRWPLFWLIDPLDGTKEFIKGSRDFTVNIALIEHHQPVMGVVVAPALEHYYWGSREQGAFFQNKTELPQQIHIPNTLTYPIKIAVSRSHESDKKKWKNFIERFKGVELVYRGSALKICLVARGEVDLYPRLGPTGEWDTAAGQCILEAAGGKLVDLYGRALKYNARKTLVNEGFVAVGCDELLSLIVDKSEPLS